MSTSAKQALEQSAVRGERPPAARRDEADTTPEKRAAEVELRSPLPEPLRTSWCLSVRYACVNAL